MTLYLKENRNMKDGHRRENCTISLSKAKNLNFIQREMSGTHLDMNARTSVEKWMRPTKTWVSTAEVSSSRAKVRRKRPHPETNPELADERGA